MTASLLPVVGVLSLAASSQNWVKGLQSCEDLRCVRARLDDALDHALSTPSLPVMPGVTLELPANNTIDSSLDNPRGTLDKLSHLLSSRNINIHLAEYGDEDGRGKKKKKYGELVYLAVLLAALVLPLKLQALAVVAGKALLMAKVALVLSGSALLKKLAHPHQHDHQHRRTDATAEAAQHGTYWTTDNYRYPPEDV